MLKKDLSTSTMDLTWLTRIQHSLPSMELHYLMLNLCLKALSECTFPSVWSDPLRKSDEDVCAKIQQAIGPHKDLLTIVKRHKLQWCGYVSLSPFHQAWPKPSCKPQWKGEEDKADRGRGGKTTSGNGQAWSSPSHRGQWRTGKNGWNWLWDHLWWPNDLHSYGIDDDDYQIVHLWPSACMFRCLLASCSDQSTCPIRRQSTFMVLRQDQTQDPSHVNCELRAENPRSLCLLSLKAVLHF